MQFLELEGGYLVIGIFILVVTAFVTTRSFMSKSSFKLGMSIVGGLLGVLILAHYFVTTQRMQTVKTAFSEGKNVICESKVIRKVAQSLVINQKLGWELKGDEFVSSQYERAFHTARCIEE